MSSEIQVYLKCLLCCLYHAGLLTQRWKMVVPRITSAWRAWKGVKVRRAAPLLIFQGLKLSHLATCEQQRSSTIKQKVAYPWGIRNDWRAYKSSFCYTKSFSRDFWTGHAIRVCTVPITRLLSSKGHNNHDRELVFPSLLPSVNQPCIRLFIGKSLWTLEFRWAKMTGF